MNIDDFLDSPIEQPKRAGGGRVDAFLDAAPSKRSHIDDFLDAPAAVRSPAPGDDAIYDPISGVQIAGSKPTAPNPKSLLANSTLPAELRNLPGDKQILESIEKAKPVDNGPQILNAQKWTPAEKRSTLRAVADSVLGLYQGATGMVKGVTDNINAGDNPVSNALQTIIDAEERLKSGDLKEQQATRNMLIYGAKKSGEAAAAKAAIQTLFDYPAAGGDVVARGVGSIAPTLAMGAMGAGTRAMGAVNAFSNAGDAASQVADQLRALPLSAWANDPQYQELVQGGMDPQAAINLLIPIKALPAQTFGGITGAASGLTGLERQLAGQVAGNTIKDRAKRAASEIVGEQAETLVPQITGNATVGGIDQKTKLLEGTGQAAVDTLAGTVPGAALAARKGAVVAAPAPSMNPGMNVPPAPSAGAETAPSTNAPSPSAPTVNANDVAPNNAAQVLSNLITRSALPPSAMPVNLENEQSIDAFLDAPDENVSNGVALPTQEAASNTDVATSPAQESAAEPAAIAPSTMQKANAAIAGEPVAPGAQPSTMQQAQAQVNEPAFIDTDKHVQVSIAKPGMRVGDIVHKNGNVFKTSKLAKSVAKQAGPGWVIAPSNQGYVVRYRPQTDKQIAARQKTIAKQRQVLKTDSMLQAISKLGGINSDELANTWGVSLADLNDKGAGIFRVATKNGRSADDIATLLKELGYISEDQHGKHDLAEMMDLFMEEARGAAKTYASNDGGGIEALYNQYQNDGYDEWIAAKDAQEAEFNKLSEEAQTLIGEIVAEDYERTQDEDEGLRQEIAQWEQSSQFQDRIPDFNNDNIEPTGGRLAQEAGEFDTNPAGEDRGDQGVDETTSSPRAQQDSVRQTRAGSQRTTEETFSLESQTEAALKAAEEAKAAAEKAKQEADRAADAKAKADAEVSQFTLTGSDRSADVQAAQGQQDLLVQPPSKARIFRRTSTTKEVYDARIDALFSGDKAIENGVVVLDHSDVLGLFGLDNLPVKLSEGKLIAGMSNHPLMNALVWKKVPEWLENPAAVFDSDTVKGRLVFIAPELVNGSAVRIIVQPDLNDKRSNITIHLLQNAYDASGKAPYRRWFADGLGRYVDQKKFPTILHELGLQLPNVEWQNKPGTRKILTEKDLAGYRKSISPETRLFSSSSGDHAAGSVSAKPIEALVNGIVDRFPGAPIISLYSKVTDIFPLEDAESDTRVSGAVVNGEIMLFLKGLKSMRDAERTVFHELLHYGLRRFLTRDQFITQMNKLYTQDASLRAYADDWMKNDPVGKDTLTIHGERYARARGVDEALAVLAEKTPEQFLKPNAWTKLQETLRKWLAQLADFLGFKSYAAYLRSMNPSEAAQLIRDTFTKLEDNAKPAKDPFVDLPDTAFRIQDINEELQDDMNLNTPDSPYMAMSVSDFAKVSKNAIGHYQWSGGEKLYRNMTIVAKKKLGALKLADNKPAAFTQMLRQFRVDQLKANENAKAIAAAGKDLSPEQRVLLADLVENNARAADIPTQEIVELAASVTSALESQAHELVDLGMLSQDRLVKNYLPRLYKHGIAATLTNKDVFKSWFTKARLKIRGNRLKSRGLYTEMLTSRVAMAKKLGWKASSLTDGSDIPTDLFEAFDKSQPIPPNYQDTKVLMWRDYTEAERADMGEIRDGVLRYAMGYVDTQKDIAIGRLFKAIAGNSELAKTHNPGGWIKVPTAEIAGAGGVKQFGALSGMFVNEQVYDALSRNTQPKGVLMAMYDKALSFWKEGKTVWNPVSHSNNVVSNLFMVYFAGVNPLNPVKWRETMREFKTRGQYWNEAVDNGLFGNEIANEEIRQLLMPDLTNMADMETVAASRVAKMIAALTTKGSWKSPTHIPANVLIGYREKMQKAYEFEDQFFKLMIFMDRRKHGINLQDSITEAERYIFNYSDLPKTIESIKRYGIPFFAYTYKAIPAILHTFWNHPHRLLTPIALLGGANWLAYAFLGADEEKERKGMPEYLQGRTMIRTHKAIRMPWNDDAGRPVFIDMSRRVPLGDLFDAGNKFGGIPFPAPFMPSHPLFTAIQSLFYNQDTYTGKDLVKKSDSNWEAAQARAAYLYRQFAPNAPMIPGSYNFNKLADAMAYQFDTEMGPYTGRTASGDAIKPVPALLDVFTGTKIRSFDPARGIDLQDAALLKEVKEIKANVASANRNKSMSEKSRNAYIAEQESKMRELERRHNELRQ